MASRNNSQSSLAELKELWKKEHEHYKKSEVGSGVQSFVWDVFQSSDLFNLKRGLKSTEDHSRKGEFMLEERNKGGQADAVIFMDSEVVIPVEVEKLDKAQSGEWQILKYRTAFDKKYGILTDGSEWRFYYGEIEDKKHIKFTIEEMFAEPERFRTFWDEYVKPKNYYLSFFEEQVGQQKMEIFDQRLMVDEHRERFFEDVTDIIKKLKDKLLNAGYFRSIKDGKERDKKATEIAYSYLIQFILYKTLVDNVFDDFEEEFAKKSEVIHQNLKKESFNSVLMILEGMSGKISENIYKPFHTEQAAILGQVKDIVHSGEDNLMNVAPFLDIFVFIKKYHFADVQNDIFGAIYENYLKELYEEQQLGQYFTDPAVVNFMLEEIGYTAAEIKKRGHDNISIIDPSCGSGTFLYSAVREIVKARDYSKEEESRKIEQEVLNNIFGLDIAEFPLYLAEMSILMKMLPIIVNKKYNNPIDKKLKLFVTEDSVAEFVGEIGGRVAGSGEGGQQKIALGWHYAGFMREERDLDEMKNSLNTMGSGKKTIPRKRFDFVIGNPPYISYNECSKMGIKVFNLLKEKGSDVSLNNIYGWNLHSTPKNRKKYSPKPNLYAFFVALGFGLLKENGKFCYIIPQTLLYLPDLDVLRYRLSTEYTIEKIITFAGNLFVGRGTNQKKKIRTSSLIIVCSKKKPIKSSQVFCKHSTEEDESVPEVLSKMRADKKNISKFIPQSLLEINSENWNFINWEKEMLGLFEKYKENSEDISVYYEHLKAQEKFGDRFYFDVGFTLDKEHKYENKSGTDKHYLIPDLKHFVGFGNYLFSAETYYPENKIGFTQNSQGLETIRKQYKIIWSINNPKHFYVTELPIVFAMAVYGIISSDSKDEILYLFSLLNSKINFQLLLKFFYIKQEKCYSFTAQRIKKFIRIPIIDSVDSKKKKQAIIKLTERMLEMEKRTFADLVDVDTLIQHFDDVRVEGTSLVLKSGPKEVRAAIRQGSTNLIQKTLDVYFGSQKSLLGARQIGLAELKSLSAFDKEEQDKIKEEIDELVFDLYELTKDERALINRSVS